jgi:hypothetical protein
MSEAEARAWIWECSTKRIIQHIEVLAESWTANGPSKATAERIVREIRDMPVPGPAAGDQE